MGCERLRRRHVVISEALASTDHLFSLVDEVLT